MSLLPAFLPQELLKLDQFKEGTELVQYLEQNVDESILFLTSACQDDSWLFTHEAIIKELFEKLTIKFFDQQITFLEGQRVAQVILQHIFELRYVIQEHFKIIVESKEFLFNGLLLGSSSLYFYKRTLGKFKAGKLVTLRLKNVEANVFETVAEYIQTGSSLLIWKKNADELLNLLHVAFDWQLLGLVKICEDMLKRYIDRDNVFDYLKIATDKNLHFLLQACVDLINHQQWDLLLKVKEDNSLIFKFSHFTYHALEVFQLVKRSISVLICRKELTEDLHFDSLLHQISRLETLDVNQSHVPLRVALPLTTTALHLSSCPWLDASELAKIIRQNPQLRSLDLKGNVQLSYTAWTHLNSLKDLIELHLSWCAQIHKDEFRLILNACLGLVHLEVEECIGLEDAAFLELGKLLSNLAILNLARCNLSDGSLLEIASNNRYKLRELNLARCPLITEKGVNQVLKMCSGLRKIDINQTQLSMKTIEELKQRFPSVQFAMI